MHLESTGDLWFWKGPSPFHFVTVPEAECVELAGGVRTRDVRLGMIPVTAEIGATEWKTSLFPKDGGTSFPVQGSRPEGRGLEVGDVVAMARTWTPGAGRA